MGPAALSKTFEIEGIAKPGPLKKFGAMTNASFSAKQVPDKGSYTALHMKVPVSGDIKADVIVFSSDKVLVTASPSVGAGTFDQFADKIRKIAEGCVKPVGQTRSLAALRAAELIEYCKSLNMSDEKERMIVVILSDTANEIVLTEKMRALKIQGEALRAGIPDKISQLEKKGETIYKKDNVAQIRELRNSVVHSGSIPSKAETGKVVEWSEDFVINY